ncbi:MAG: S-methyl-5-thioribose-1-phosphate isomerase, partial [Dehalococcoidia bacterium]
MSIRGAPAIGILGAYGMALGALGIGAKSKSEFLKKLREINQTLAATRPTARNLFQAIDRMQQVAEASKNTEQIKKALVA